MCKVDAFIPAAEWMAIMQPLLEQGHLLKISPSGNSMRPLIVGGRDEVVLSASLGKKLKRGDIVLFSRDDGTYVLHRIYKIKGDQYIINGDSQTWTEGPVEPSCIVAVAESVIHCGWKITCGNPGYRAFVGIWLFLRPVRPLLLGAMKAVYNLANWRTHTIKEKSR